MFNKEKQKKRFYYLFHFIHKRLRIMQAFKNSKIIYFYLTELDAQNSFSLASWGLKKKCFEIYTITHSIKQFANEIG